MDAIEKRARELLANEHRQDPRRAKGIRIGHKSVSRDDHLAVCAIIAALTPAVDMGNPIAAPKGYVLVPIADLQKITNRHTDYGGEGYAHDEAAALVANILAARSEVP